MLCILHSEYTSELVVYLRRYIVFVFVVCVCVRVCVGMCVIHMIPCYIINPITSGLTTLAHGMRCIDTV